MVLAEISIKLIFLPKRKESCVPLLVVQIHFVAPMVCLRAFTSSSLCTEACIFAKSLSFYTYLILCELWMRVTIVAKLGTRIVLSSIEFFFYSGSNSISSVLITFLLHGLP